MQAEKKLEIHPDAGELDFNQLVEQGLARLKNPRARTLFELTIATLDQSNVERALATELADSGIAVGKIKASEIPIQLLFASVLAVSLGLDKLPPSKILGIGRNVTHLLCCAKALGHQVTLVTPSNASHDRILQLYGLDRPVQTKSLPTATFDVAIATNLAHSSQAAWAIFLRPVMRLLAPDGQVFLTVQRQPSVERKFDPKTTLEMFHHLGARITFRNSSIALGMPQIKALVAEAFPRNEPVVTKGPKLRGKAAPRPRSDNDNWIAGRWKTIAIAAVGIVLLTAGLGVWIAQ